MTKNIENYEFLYDFQKEGINELLKAKYLLADEVGLGKTVQAMVFADIKEYKKILVVCPAALKRQWAEEIERFIKRKTVILDGKPDERKEQLQEYEQDTGIRYLIINYAQLRLHNFPDFDLMILDEVHRIKNKKTKTYKAAQRINVNEKIGLTATPFINNPGELHTICDFLGYFTPWYEFSKQYCKWDKVHIGRGRKINKIVGYKNMKTLHKRLSLVMVRRKKKDVMEQLPKRRYKNHYIKPTREQKHLINTYMTDARTCFYNEEDRSNILANLTLARMACDSTELIEKSDSPLAIPVKKRKSAKLAVLQEVIEQVQGKILIFTNWAVMANILGRELDNVLVITGDTNDIDARIEEFRNGDYKCLVATDCLNYGVNLQFIGTLIHFDLPFSPAKMEQREGRIDRIGQEHSMLIIKLIIEGSVEERIVNILEQKQKLFDEAVEGRDEVESLSFIKEMFENR